MPPITRAILLSMAGTYTLEDDGIVGNATSQLRRPDGGIIEIEHPLSLLKFTASEPGVTLVFNMVDSLDSARLIVGDLTNSSLSPETIVVRQIISDTSVTLAATGRIYDNVQNEAEADIYASRLTLSAPGGIGENFFPLETHVGTLEAEAVIRGIFVKNTGDLVVGGLTDQVAGLDVATSGDIFVTTTGSLRLSDVTAEQVVRGSGSSGNVTLEALNGISADVASRAVVAPAGNVTLRGGFGDVSLSADNDVLARGSVSVSGRSVFLAGDADLVANAFVGGPPGSVSVYGASRIDIQSDASITAPDIDGGNVSLQTGAGGQVGIFATGAQAIYSASGAVSIQTDSIEIDSASGITAGSTVQLVTASINRPIMLGAAANPQTTFALDGIELNRVFAPSLGIGNYNSGTVTVGGVVDLAYVDSIGVRSRGDVSVNYDITLAGAVRFETAGNFVQQAGTNVAATQYAVYVDFFDTNGSGESPQLLGTRSVTMPFELFGGDDDDTLTGNDSPDLLAGNGGNDILDGRGGADYLEGYTGNDTYYVDDAGDLVIELAGQGDDVAFASVNWTLAAGIELERLGTIDNNGGPIDLTGNEYAQSIYGSAGANRLSGGGGDDLLIGFAGDDVLIGGTGADAMRGDAGNDVFYVDAASDLVLEAAGEGSDRVAASASYTLAAGASVEMLEAITLGDTTPLDLTGNAFGQYVIGNNGANLLQSGGGNDWLIGAGGNDTIVGSASASTMEGGLGNDVYLVIDSSDFVIEASGGGADRIAAGTSYTLGALVEVETLEAINLGDTTALSFTGNLFQNMIVGNNGANVLDGKGGADVLNGAGGADTFAFTTAPAANNVDTVLGFLSGTDRIGLDDAVFTAIAPGALQAGAFVVAGSAQDGDDRIIYDQAAGALFYDPDGTGEAAQIQFATLQGAPLIGAGDFALI